MIPVKIRKHYLHKQATVSDSGVQSTGLAFNFPITALEIVFEATIAAAHAHDNPLTDFFTNFEVGDASYSVFNLPAKEAIAFSYYMLKRSPQINESEVGAAVPTYRFVIPFGLYYGDPNHYLLPSNYNSLMLKITSAINTTYQDTGTGKVTVIAHTIEQGAGDYRGVVRVKSHFDDTSAASGTKQFDGPLDDPWLACMLTGRITAVAPTAVVTNVKIIDDNGNYIPFDERTVDLLASNVWSHPPFECNLACAGAADGIVLSPVWNIRGLSCIALVATYYQADIVITAEKILAITNLEGATPTATAHTTTLPTFNVRGYQPYGTLWMPFGNIENGEVLPVSDVGNRRIEMVNGSASATLKMVIAQLAQK
jgi:hypothetical protein